MKETPRLGAVDGLRAMAMLMVFTFHTWEFANKPEFVSQPGSRSFGQRFIGPLGVQGVLVFMVLSGFCLFFPLCFNEERLRNFDWKNYAMRRVRRIVPPYYAAIIYALLPKAILATARHFTGLQTHESAWPTPFDLLTHLTFIHTLFPSTFFSMVGAFWSLGLEAQFYLLFPLVVWAFARVGKWSIVAIIAVSLCFHVALHILGVGYGEVSLKEQVLRNFFLNRWLEFGMGMWTAQLVARNIQRSVPTPMWQGVLLVTGGLLWFFFPIFSFGQPDLAELIRSVAVGAMIYAVCTSTRPVAFLWSNRVSAFVGFISYSFFLIHQPTMFNLSQLLLRVRHGLSGTASFAVLMTVGFVVCLAISYVFFLIFEKPFLKSWPLVWARKTAG